MESQSILFRRTESLNGILANFVLANGIFEWNLGHICLNEWNLLNGILVRTESFSKFERNL